jgi:hypothetical protein
MANLLAASQSFRREEIDAIRELFRLARRGGDIKQIMQSPHLVNVERKFRGMQDRIFQNIRVHGLPDEPRRGSKLKLVPAVTPTFEIPEEDPK